MHFLPRYEALSKKRSSKLNKIRERRAEMINWKDIYPKIKINQAKFCGKLQQYILEVWGRSEHIADATKLAQKICRSVLWE